MGDLDKLGKAGKTGDGSGGGSKADEVPYSFDAMPSKTAADLNPTQKGSQPVWIAFVPQNQKQALDAQKVISDPSKRPQSGTFWSYKLTYPEQDNVAGISSREEAEAFLKQVESLPDFSALEKKSPTPSVFSYVPGGKN